MLGNRTIRQSVRLTLSQLCDSFESIYIKEGDMSQAYCMKCRGKVEIKNPQKITMKNKRPATTGTCPKCRTKVFRIG